MRRLNKLRRAVFRRSPSEASSFFGASSTTHVCGDLRRGFVSPPSCCHSRVVIPVLSFLSRQSRVVILASQRFRWGDPRGDPAVHGDEVPTRYDGEFWYNMKNSTPRGLSKSGAAPSKSQSELGGSSGGSATGAWLSVARGKLFSPSEPVPSEVCVARRRSGSAEPDSGQSGRGHSRLQWQRRGRRASGLARGNCGSCNAVGRCSSLLVGAPHPTLPVCREKDALCQVIGGPLEP